jgi:hypothetical protein
MKKTMITLGCLASLVSFAATADACVGERITVEVRRGDANADRNLDHADVKAMLGILFGGERAVVSIRDLDYNMDGRFDIADVDALIADLSLGGARPAVARGETALLGDTNDDGKVDVADLSTLFIWFTGGERAAAPDQASDINGDGWIDIADLAELASVIGL